MRKLTNKKNTSRWIKRNNVSAASVIAAIAVVALFTLMGVIEAKADYVDTDSSSQSETITDSDGNSQVCFTDCVVGGGCYTTCF